MLTEILMILVILNLRQHRRNMNDTQAVKKKGGQTSHVTTSVRVFQHGAERGGLYNQQEVWFQLSALSSLRSAYALVSLLLTL